MTHISKSDQPYAGKNESFKLNQLYNCTYQLVNL